MCEYIKDDGEQCSMDEHPFCHHHKDTQFAYLYKLHTTTSSATSQLDDAHHCGDCESPITAVVGDVTETASTTMHDITIVGQCDCSETVIYEKTMGETALPAGWT